MKKMYIEDAVKYCLNHKAVIHTPTKDIFDSLMSYLDESSPRWSNGLKASKFNCYSVYKDDTCIHIIKQDYNINYSCVNYYKDIDYEIIELNIKSVSIDNTIYYNKEDAVNKIESIFSSFPSAGDIYYYIDITGEVSWVSWDTWDNHEIDNNRLSIGNVYKTEELASIALDRVLKAYKG